MLLMKPNNDGWVRFQLRGTREYSISCTDAIPSSWLEQTIHGLESKMPFCVTGETDPGKLICVVGWNCHVLWEEDRESVRAGKIKHEYSDVNMLSFARMLYNDISTYITDWVRYYGGSSAEKQSKRRAELEDLLARLQTLLDGETKV